MMLSIPCVVITRLADKPQTSEDINPNNTSGVRVITSKPLQSLTWSNGLLVDDYWPLAKAHGIFGRDLLFRNVSIGEEDFQSFFDDNKL